jgi:predicted nucleic acid-binding protein
MNNVYVLNASPLILLGKSDLLRVVSPLAELWVIPEGVAAEVEIKKPVSTYINGLNSYSKATRETVRNILPRVAAWDLGNGESEVLTLAMEHGGNCKAVLDDLQARKCANLFGVPLVGTLGLLVMAKRVGLVKVVRPEIEKLIGIGLRIDPVLLSGVYQKVGE